MRWKRSVSWLVTLATMCLGADHGFARSDESGIAGKAKVVQVPDSGIQPQAAIDERGVIHLVFFKGEPAGGDLYYTRLEPGETRFTPRVRVNSKRGSAIAIGTVRGGQIAIGKGGRVHVAWNGTNGAVPKNPLGGVPMLYSRSDSGRTSFEPQRNLMKRTSMLDGGGTVAADREGNVYVAWHGFSEDGGRTESSRRMWVARSTDDGATFSPESPAYERETGACGCCGARAFVDRRGSVHLLYRAATGGADRDMYLLSSDDHAGHFRGEMIDHWRADACPMSTSAMAQSGDALIIAWETRGEVYIRKVGPGTRQSRAIAPSGGGGDRKHPAVAGNARGETILVWTEGTGWQRGGSLAWQVFDQDNRPIGPRGRIEGGVPIWGLSAVVAMPDGSFTILSSQRPAASAGARTTGHVAN